MKEQGAERVTLYRDEKNLYINGVRFPMRRLKRESNSSCGWAI